MLRNATAYGVSPRMRLDLVLANLMASGYATGVIKVLSDGTPWRPMVHIEDISRAALAALTAEEGSLQHSVFNIGTSDCNYTVREIAEISATTLTGYLPSGSSDHTNAARGIDASTRSVAKAAIPHLRTSGDEVS